MTDERAAQRKVANWLRKTTDLEVYWDRDPPAEYDRFWFDNVADLPDLLATGEITIVIEMKDGTDSSGIYDAMKDVHQYWRSYEYDGEEIEIKEGTVEAIDAFVIATQFSPDGHLFKRDPNDAAPDGDDREKGFRRTFTDREQWNQGMRPQYEYARTEAIPRIMWRYAWLEAETRDEARADIETGLGVLLSDKLDKNPTQRSFDEFTTDEPTSHSPKVLYYDGKEESRWAPI